MYELIQHQEIGSGGASSIIFDGIPQIYTDLYVVTSTRSTSSGIHSLYWRFNDSSTGYTARFLRGNGSTVLTGINTPAYLQMGYNTPSDYTANTFSSTSFYVTNYTSLIPKSVTVDSASENSSNTAYHMIAAGLWDIATDEPITKVTLSSEAGSLAQYTSATLYGVGRKQAIGKPKAVGGAISYDNGYWVHTFTGSSAFYAQEDLEIDALVVAGGGGSGIYEGRYNGGGGAGGFRTISKRLISSGSYPILVGSGGAGAPSRGRGSKGSDSIFLDISSTGGGEGGLGSEIGSPTGGAGGSGGGGTSVGGSGGAGNQGGYSPVEGYSGGATSTGGGSGGGGAGGVGGSAGSGGDGGAGGPGAIWHGQYYAGGGGGNGNTGGAGGIGGGGTGGTTGSINGTSGTANTGGGAGGTALNLTPATSGGSGIVIVRYKA